MKIFLTGATGYIGSVVAEKLQNKGYEITGLARNEESEAKLREKGIEPLRGDLKTVESLKRGAKEADAVIHTAFIHDFGGYASTGETVADENFPYDRNSPFFSRAEAEQDALALSQKGIRSIVLRLPLFVYGRAGSSFVPFLINQARE